MAEILLHSIFLLLPLTGISFLKMEKQAALNRFLILLLSGIVFSFASIKYYSNKQAQLGNNIDVGSLLLLVLAGFSYLILLPILIFSKKKKSS